MTYYMFEKLVEAAPERKADYLEKGDLIHTMLEFYYKEKMKPTEQRLPHARMIEMDIDLGREKVISMDMEIEVSEEDVIPTFRQYCEYWEGKPDPETPVAVEQRSE